MKNALTSERLRARRRRLGISQARLAKIAGCSLASIAKAEQGAVPRTSEVLGRVAAVLETLERRDRGT